MPKDNSNYISESDFYENLHKYLSSKKKERKKNMEIKKKERK